MSQGNDFANYGSHAEDKSGTDGLWYVAVATDDIKTMTLDQLDDAFRLGVISGDTSVWTDGMEAWAPLRVVADLDGSGSQADEESEEASLEEEETQGHQRQAHQQQSHSVQRQPVQSHPVQSHQARAQQAQAPQAQAQWQAPAAKAPAANPFAPAVSLAPSGSPFGAVVEGPSSSLSPFGLSTAPVALNVDEDEEMPMKRARRSHPERWAIGAVALCAVGFALFRNDVFASSPASEQPVMGASAINTQVTGLALNATKAEPAKPASKGYGLDGVGDEDSDEPAAAKEKAEPAEKAAAAKADDDEEKPAAVASNTTASVKSSSASGSSVADALRKKPAILQKPSGKKAKPMAAKKASRSSKSAKRASATSKSPISSNKGGSAFDPLNGSIP